MFFSNVSKAKRVAKFNGLKPRSCEGTKKLWAPKIARSMVSAKGPFIFYEVGGWWDERGHAKKMAFERGGAKKIKKGGVT